MNAEALKAAEDKIAAFFGDEDRELDLRVWKYLRLRYPNQSSNLIELERDIAQEAKRHA